MVRKIKFRAWDKVGKVMIKNVGITLSKESDVNDFATNISIHNKKVVLMQFTGLKDKNGKEIYEGDILKAIYSKYKNSWFKKVVVVVIEEGSYGNEFVYKQISNKKIDFDEARIDWKMYSEFLVIGNKFENPELLK